MLNLTEQNFNSITSQPGIVMVDCWAEWCGACKEFNPIFDKTAKKFSMHTFTKLDSVKEKNLVSEINIENIPTLLLYRDGILLFKQAGYYEEEKLVDILKQAENLDMNLVREQIEKEKKQTDN